MESRPTDYYDPAAASRPAPQLTKAQLQAMHPDDVVHADNLGQFEVLKSQHRDPLPMEQRGERLATAEEIAAAARVAAADRNQTRQDAVIAARKEGLDV